MAFLIPELITSVELSAAHSALTAAIMKPAGKTGRFHPDQIVSVFMEGNVEAG